MGVERRVNGYRYHAAAVARSLLSRPQARWAVGQSARFDSDFGRGCGPERLVAGGIETVGGALFTLRDGEAGHLGTGPWARGRWHLYGERGGVFGDQQCVGWSPSGPTEHRIIWEHGNGPAGDAIQSVRLEGFPALRWESPLPEAALDADALAVATCILDWLARIDGQKSDSAWSPRDAFLDLVWTEAVERSASLGGIRIRVSAVRDDKEPPEGG